MAEFLRRQNFGKYARTEQILAILAAAADKICTGDCMLLLVLCSQKQGFTLFLWAAWGRHTYHSTQRHRVHACVCVCVCVCLIRVAYGKHSYVVIMLHVSIREPLYNVATFSKRQVNIGALFILRHFTIQRESSGYSVLLYLPYMIAHKLGFSQGWSYSQHKQKLRWALMHTATMEQNGTTYYMHLVSWGFN